jgi:hypothetical protein
VEEQVDSLTAYDVATAMDETSIIPVQNKVVSKEINNANAYLKTDVRTLAVGQAYAIDEAVKTTDGKMLRVTKEVKSLNLADALAVGELKTYSNATYRALKGILAYDNTTTYVEDDYALGRPAIVTITVDVSGIVQAGEISLTIGDTTPDNIQVTTDSTAASIAADIVEAVGTIEGWTITDNEDGTITIKCDTAGANTLAFSFTDVDETGVVVSAETVAGADTISVYDGSSWSVATLAGMAADETLFDAVTAEWIESNYTVQNVMQYDLAFHQEGYTFSIGSDRISIYKNNYCLVNGVETAKSNYGGASITTPVSLYKGDTISIRFPRGSSNNKDIDIIAYKDKAGNYHRLMGASNSKNITSISYTLQEDYAEIVFSSDAAMSIGSNTIISVYRPNADDATYYKYKKYYNDWLIGAIASFGVVGQPFNYKSASYGSTANTARQLIPCKKGDKFVINITGRGGGNNCVWCIIDVNDVVIAGSGNSALRFFDNYEVSIPDNAKYIVFYGDLNIAHSVYKKVKTEEEAEDNSANMSLLMYNSNAANVSSGKTIPDVGNVFTFSAIGGGRFHSLPVNEGEKYTLSSFFEDSTYSGYAIINANNIVIKKVYTPLQHFCCHMEVEIPSGGCWLIFNTRHGGINYSSSTNPCWVRRVKDMESIVETNKHKESSLMTMSRIKKSQNTYSNRLTMAWISDNHFDIIRYSRFINYVDNYGGYITAILNTGDNNRTSDYDKGWEKTVGSIKSSVPMLPVLGNHDCFGFSSTSSNVLNSGSRQWQGEHYIVPVADSAVVFDQSENGSKCYYYRDYGAEKIRVIVINDYDKPRIANSSYWQTTTDESEISSAVEWVSGTTYNVGDIIHYKGLYIKCKRQSQISDNGSVNSGSNDSRVLSSTNSECRYIDQAQLDFIVDAMLTAPSGYGIVFAAHMSLEAVNSNTPLADENWNSYNIFTDNPINVPYGQNGYLLKDLIAAYLDRGVLYKTYKAITPNKNPEAGTIISGFDDVILDVDFSSAGGDVICFLNGHQHTDSCFYATCGTHRVLDVGLTNGGFTDNYWNLTSAQPTIWVDNDLVRDGQKRDSFNIISFDTTRKEVYLLRIGADMNDRFEDRNFTKVSYTH